MAEPDYIRAHRHISRREEILRSDVCGCFYCLNTFPPSQILDWIDERDGVGVTPLCPRCGIDSVLGSASGFPVTAAFLRQMHEHWF